MPTIYSGPPTVTSENNTESDSDDLEAEGMFIIAANDQKVLPTQHIKTVVIPKGQITSECIYKIIDFSKYHRKKLIDFSPGRFYRLCTCDLF